MKSEQLTCREPSELDSHSKKLDISTEAKNTRTPVRSFTIALQVFFIFVTCSPNFYFQMSLPFC